ncbi:MAG: cysteine--tRNA ligase [Candidatus Binataceae bacterium]
MKPFHIFNTLSRSVEEFTPIAAPRVSLYACGPTVYLAQHLGNLRTYLNWDFLRRALELDGFKVQHVMNVTDVGHMTSDEDEGEDKIEKTARAEGIEPIEVANKYLAQFNRDCRALNVEPPHVVCRATGHIADMIALIERIVAAGCAYIAPSGVYFDVPKWRGEGGMGRLSRQRLEDQFAGQRLEHSADKRSPHDFALWVLNQPRHLMQWQSPWGRGYPGWHIECSAMSMRYLGETIDIHTGGIDHIPVHHENEIEQSESATAKPFVRYFVHSAFLVGKDGWKISKSAGSFPVLDELTSAGYDPLTFRLFCLGAKYRSELMFNDEGLHAARQNLEYFREFARNSADEALSGGGDAAWVAEFRAKFEAALFNDLNTPQALAAALQLVAESYRRKDPQVWEALRAFDSVLALNLEQTARVSRKAGFPPEVASLINARTAARKSHDFKRADELRERLEGLGLEVKDNRDGTATYQKRQT